MGRRLDLQKVLEAVLGSRNVYFQPDENIRMSYPCIVYQRDWEMVHRADNLAYLYEKRYVVTVIDPNPDSDIPDRIRSLPKASFVRFFTKGNLNHDIFNLYF